MRSLKDLKRKGRAEKPEWVKQMASRQRKTLVVCQECHTDIHAGRHSKHAAKKRIEDTGEPDEAKVSRPVRRGGRWKSARKRVTRRRPTLRVGGDAMAGTRRDLKG